jgi:multicomponent Na+:H+ antiporter subunit D
VSANSLSQYLLIVIVFTPLIGALLVLLTARRKKLQSAVVILTCLTALILVIWAKIISGLGIDIAFRLYIGLPFWITFKFDDLNFLLACLSTSLWIMASVYTVKYVEKHLSIFNGFLLLSLSGMLGLIFAENLFTLLLFFESFSVLTTALVIHDRTPAAIRAGFQYLFISIVGTIITIVGVVILYQNVGTLGLFTTGISGLKDFAGATLLFWLLAAGFLAKAGIFPIHVWLPEAHPIAPSPASALLSGVIIKAGAYGVIRIAYGIFGAKLLLNPFIANLLLILAAITMILGSVVALVQVELKRLLAFSSVAQIGHVLLGIGLAVPLGLAGATLQIVAHGIAKGALFLVAGCFIAKLGRKYISELQGIGREMPLTFLAFTFASLSIIGIPPFIGFFSKWLLALGALDASQVSISPVTAYVIVGIIILSGLLTALYYLPIIVRGWFLPAKVSEPVVETSFNGAQVEESPGKLELSGWLLAPTLVLGLATLVFGIYVNWPMGIITKIVNFYF